MSRDIRMVVERKVGSDWVAVHIPEPWHDRMACRMCQDSVLPLCRDQNYPRFTALIDWRDGGPVRAGIPDDVSQTARYLIAQSGDDGATHSWLPLQDAAAIFLDTEHHQVSEFHRQFPCAVYFNVEDEIEPIDECRLVYWFEY